MKTNDTDKRLKLQERLLTIKKRNKIRWNIYRENNFHSRREVSKCSLKIRCATNADCRLADLQTCRLEDLQTHILCDRALLCLLLANRKVCLRQTAALAGCKHDSARFDRWLEILAVEDLTLEERWPNFSESSEEEDGWDHRAALSPGLYSGMTSVSRE